ncbi:MAG: CDP-diacylglycerol--serine O-phosphatidyltransferase [Proteobacteria bacterium]|nr:CDP-diacylglycerol--serine O-phosphatidyltransferase [Pseudomonadota bacterium]
MKNDLREYPRHRGIYLIPNLFTLGALFAGFYAIVAATKHVYDNAAIAIFVAILLDGLDGRIARLTHSVSDFGAQFDSLSDMVCFGITPALVLYSWSLSTLGKAGWLICFAYTAATALRLARFNTQLGVADKRYFQGLSTTISAGLVASLIWTCVQYEIDGAAIAWLVGLVAIILAGLKVSSIRYRSFKDFNIRGKVPFLVIPIAGFIFVLISYKPPEIFLILFGLYVASGPIAALIRRWKLKSISSSSNESKPS